MSSALCVLSVSYDWYTMIVFTGAERRYAREKKTASKNRWFWKVLKHWGGHMVSLRPSCGMMEESRGTFSCGNALALVLADLCAAYISSSSTVVCSITWSQCRVHLQGVTFYGTKSPSNYDRWWILPELLPRVEIVEMFCCHSKELSTLQYTGPTEWTPPNFPYEVIIMIFIVLS